MEKNSINTPGIIVLGVMTILWGLLVGLTTVSTSNNHFIFLPEFYLLSLLPIFAGVGVLTKKNWCRILYILCQIIGVCYYSFLFIKSFIHNGVIAKDVFGLFQTTTIFIINMWYFYRREVKEQFN